MFRTPIACVAALCLAACSMTGGVPGIPTAAPAPLAKTTVDDTGLETAWRAFDAFLDALNLPGVDKVIVPGSPRGIALAFGIRKVTKALSAAENFAAAGSTTDYLRALTEAKAGIAELRSIVKGQ